MVWHMRGLKVYALVGKSGTGKSFRARLLAEKLKIDALIDDGLLIKDQKIIAGKSAKKEAAYLAAVKTALFTDPNHRAQVKKALESSKIKRVLLLGTSDRMIQKICEILQLPKPTKIIQIEDIATADEINTAIHYRKHHGKHVIPVPAIEVKKNYPKIMADSLKIMLRSGFGMFKRSKLYEKTVVRPEFSNRGVINISEAALSQMIMHCVAEHSPGFKIHKLVVRQDGTGYSMNLHLDVPFGRELAASIHDLHTYIIEKLEQYTGIIVDELNITVNKIIDK
ncbi:peptide ABC transporter ATPase [Spirochaeta lutea]|uniref:Peptide ABC transporter ATPase n=1 Tax=Spirochaeta lutea TaxID=1480694 RepID=A0A098QTN0_9SPIO|nr:peptide ABC transporter ATPase [Spirochaeta lutea]